MEPLVPILFNFSKETVIDAFRKYILQEIHAVINRYQAKYGYEPMRNEFSLKIDILEKFSAINDLYKQVNGHQSVKRDTQPEAVDFNYQEERNLTLDGNKVPKFIFIYLKNRFCVFTHVTFFVGNRELLSAL